MTGQVDSVLHRYVLGVSAFMLVFVSLDNFIAHRYQPQFWSDCVGQLASAGTIAVFVFFLTLSAVLVGIATLSVHALVTFVVPHAPTPGRAVLQTLLFVVGLVSMLIGARVIAPILVSVLRVISAGVSPT